MDRVEMSQEMIDYCKADVEITRRLYRTHPKALSIWQTLWIILSGLVMNRFGRKTYLRFLKCDAKGCPHLEFHKELTQDHVGKPCPRCGANLLTQADFNAPEKETK